MSNTNDTMSLESLKERLLNDLLRDYSAYLKLGWSASDAKREALRTSCAGRGVLAEFERRTSATQEQPR